MTKLQAHAVYRGAISFAAPADSVSGWLFHRPSPPTQRNPCWSPIQTTRPGARLSTGSPWCAQKRRKDEAASFTWCDYRDLVVMAHVQLGAPIVLIWDNLNRHICPEMRRFIADNGDWLRVFQLPSYAPDLNPVEGIWSLLNRGGLANLAAASLDHLVRVIKRGLKKVQHRPYLIDGCLAGTGLVLKPP